MNRTTVVALAAAAVLGTTGGVTVALSTAGDRSETPAAQESDTPTDASAAPGDKESDKPAKGDDALLYYADGAIHDGDQNVAVPSGVAANDVRALARVDGGWLVVQVGQDSSFEDFHTGTFITTDGDDWRIGEWYGSWDITEERDGVVYGNSVSWHLATFADRSIAPLDILDGAGKELPYMEVVTNLRGIAIGADGLITGWEDKANGGTHRLVETEDSQWSHEPWGPKGPKNIELPITSPDGSQAVAAHPNPQASEDAPFGACLTGGPSDDPGAWWSECEIGTPSLEPWSPDEERLLVQGIAGDGPGPSWLRVIDPATNKALSNFDPGGILAGAEWADDTTVFTLTYDNTANSAIVKRCDTATETCKLEKRVGDNAILGSR